MGDSQWKRKEGSIAVLSHPAARLSVTETLCVEPLKSQRITKRNFIFLMLKIELIFTNHPLTASDIQVDHQKDGWKIK